MSSLERDVKLIVLSFLAGAVVVGLIAWRSANDRQAIADSAYDDGYTEGVESMAGRCQEAINFIVLNAKRIDTTQTIILKWQYGEKGDSTFNVDEIRDSQEVAGGK